MNIKYSNGECMSDNTLNQNSRQKIQTIGMSAVIFALYCFYYISGYSSKNHNYIIVALLLLWNFVACIEDSRAYSKAVISKPMGWLTLYLLFYFFSSLLNGSFVYTLEYIAIYVALYGIYYQCRYYLIRNRKREIKFISAIIISAFAVFSVNAIIFYTANPSAARTLAADFYAFDSIAIGGGYSIAFGAAILSAYLFELIIRHKIIKKSYAIGTLIGVAVLEVLVIKTESTTTIIANVVGLMVVCVRKLYFGKNTYSHTAHPSVRKFVTIVLVVAICLVVILNIQTIGESMIDATSGQLDNVVIRRFNRIGEKLYYTSSGLTYNNYVDERFDTIKISWNTFLDNPIIGVGYKCGNTFSELSSLGVGTHSEIFDLLAQHGIVGAILFFAFFLSALKKQRNISECKGYMITILIMMIFNPFKAFHCFIIIFMLIPMLEYCMDRIVPSA